MLRDIQKTIVKSESDVKAVCKGAFNIREYIAMKLESIYRQDSFDQKVLVLKLYTI